MAQNIYPILFTGYIDDLLISLNAHVLGALAYADDITLSYPSIKGLNLIVYGLKQKENEIAKLGEMKIEMVKSVRPLGN